MQLIFMQYIKYITMSYMCFVCLHLLTGHYMRANTPTCVM